MFTSTLQGRAPLTAMGQPGIAAAALKGEGFGAKRDAPRAPFEARGADGCGCDAGGGFE